jgi:pimeloyl-ACP methyl ester carboxylesterase
VSVTFARGRLPTREPPWPAPSRPHEDALPLIITHGWPGSVVEMLNVIGPLSDPIAHGGDAQDAFNVVVPSMPGYAFSGKPTATG